MATENRVGYVYSKNLINHCDKVPNLLGRASIVHSLINSYDLLKSTKIIDCDAEKFAASDENILKGFHSTEYLDILNGKLEDDTDDDQNEEYGLGYDCPPLENMYEFATTIARGSVAGAKALNDGLVDVAVNFCGGWHHAQRDQASGFCYVNDCVLAILELDKKFQRVLYIDLDIHHGDGVENAFAFSKKIFTMSIHKCEEGYFPGTGSIKDIGLGKGRYYTCNIPLKDGTSDAVYTDMFKQISEKVIEKFQPEAIVCQCGADSLARDPLGTFNLSLESYRQCIKILTQLKLPLLILGGGGYNLPNAARCFTSILAVLLDIKLDEDIPENEFFDCFGPAFELEVSPSLRRDENTQEYLETLLVQVLGNLDHVS